MKKINLTKIMAFFALFWIVIWIIWTWLLIIFDKPASNEQTLTQEQYEELLKQIEANSWVINTWAIDNVWTWITIENNK